MHEAPTAVECRSGAQDISLGFRIPVLHFAGAKHRTGHPKGTYGTVRTALPDTEIPSCTKVAVMVAVPDFTAFTLPYEVTVATVASEEVHVTPVVRFSG